MIVFLGTTLWTSVPRLRLSATIHKQLSTADLRSNSTAGQTSRSNNEAQELERGLTLAVNL